MEKLPKRLVFLKNFKEYVGVKVHNVLELYNVADKNELEEEIDITIIGFIQKLMQ